MFRSSAARALFFIWFMLRTGVGLCSHLVLSLWCLGFSLSDPKRDLMAGQCAAELSDAPQVELAEMLSDMNIAEGPDDDGVSAPVGSDQLLAHQQRLAQLDSEHDQVKALFEQEKAQLEQSVQQGVVTEAAALHHLAVIQQEAEGQLQFLQDEYQKTRALIESLEKSNVT